MEEIRKLLDSDKMIIGLKRTIKALRKSNVAKVFLAKDCPESFLEDIEYYGNFSEVQIEKLDIPCDELGSVCKKPFHITVIGVLK
ncbi:MAG: ribosomal L7Ae/L30e/S12e/Gadd45 family protein [Candidatus Nanoarchaeia archaeon]|jgi:large subunit ribosomal protein L30e|nr:ribosomal L7Ae/L30e/S12e/Gadd45 family protein [Candidatus Nanoarchaeia archaeon]